jgi:hypothetical protein
MLERVREGHSQGDECRKTSAAKVTPKRPSYDNPWRQLVSRAEFGCYIGLASDSLEFLGEYVTEQECRANGQRLVEAESEQPMIVALDIAARGLLGSGEGLDQGRPAK